MPEDFNAPKIEKPERNDANKSDRDASHELLKYAYELSAQNPLESKLQAKTRELENSKIAESFENNRPLTLVAKPADLIAPKLHAKVESSSILGSYKEPIAAAAGVLTSYGAYAGVVRLTEKCIPSPTARILVGAGTALIAGGMVNNEVSGRELLNPTGYVHNAGLSTATFALAVGSAKAASSLEARMFSSRSLSATDNLVSKGISVSSPAELKAATELLFRNSFPLNAENRALAAAGMPLKPATRALLDAHVPIVAFPKSAENATTAAITSAPQTMALIENSIPINAETRALAAKMTAHEELSLTLGAASELRFMSLGDLNFPLQSNVEMGVAAPLMPATDRLVAASIPITAETRAAAAAVQLKPNIPEQNLFTSHMRKQPIVESEMDRFRRLLFGEMEKFLKP